MWKLDKTDYVFFGLLAVLLAAASFGSYQYITAYNACLKKGYPTADIIITGQIYCKNQLTAVPL